MTPSAMVRLTKTRLTSPSPPAVSYLAASWLLAFVVTTTGCSSGPSPEMRSMQAQLADLQRQVLQLQRQVATQEDVATLQQQLSQQGETTLRANADSQVRFDNLRRSIEQLEAQVQDGNHQLSQLSEQLNSANRELQQIAANIGTGGLPTVRPPASAPASAGSSGSPGQTPEDKYSGAYNAYLRGDFATAIRGFHSYVRDHPDTDLADNALYWLGECHYRQGRYRQAIEQFDELLSRHLRSDKTASALLKKGYAFLALNERSQGILQLQLVVRDYETSDEADLARQRLAELGVDPTS